MRTDEIITLLIKGDFPQSVQTVDPGKALRNTTRQRPRFTDSVSNSVELKNRIPPQPDAPYAATKPRKWLFPNIRWDGEPSRIRTEDLLIKSQLL